MNKLYIQSGYVGAEVERAAMAGGIFPEETAMEKSIKHRLALGLAWTAKVIDPTIAQDMKTHRTEPQCC